MYLLIDILSRCTIHYWKLGFEISHCYCRTLHLSFQFYKCLLHIFWGSIAWLICVYNYMTWWIHLSSVQFNSVQSLSHIPLFATPWIAACQASLSITSSWSLLKLTPIESVMPSSHLILSHRLLLLPPIPPSIRVFSSMRWSKYWSFSFSIHPSNEHPGLISFRMDWLSPCSPRDSQESSPTPQFKSIFSFRTVSLPLVGQILSLIFLRIAIRPVSSSTPPTTRFCVGTRVQQDLLLCCRLVPKTCLTLCDPTDYSLTGSSVHEIF